VGRPAGGNSTIYENSFLKTICLHSVHLVISVRGKALHSSAQRSDSLLAVSGKKIIYIFMYPSTSNNKIFHITSILNSISRQTILY